MCYHGSVISADLEVDMNEYDIVKSNLYMCCVVCCGSMCCVCML